MLVRFLCLLGLFTLLLFGCVSNPQSPQPSSVTVSVHEELQGKSAEEIKRTLEAEGYTVRPYSEDSE